MCWLFRTKSLRRVSCLLPNQEFFFELPISGAYVNGSAFFFKAGLENACFQTSETPSEPCKTHFLALPVYAPRPPARTNAAREQRLGFTGIRVYEFRVRGLRNQGSGVWGLGFLG